MSTPEPWPTRPAAPPPPEAALTLAAAGPAVWLPGVAVLVASVAVALLCLICLLVLGTRRHEARCASRNAPPPPLAPAPLAVVVINPAGDLDLATKAPGQGGRGRGGRGVGRDPGRR